MALATGAVQRELASFLAQPAFEVAGVSVIFSHARQLNFSRTWLMTFQVMGINSNDSVVTLPSLRKRSLPQWAQAQGA